MNHITSGFTSPARACRERSAAPLLFLCFLLAAALACTSDEAPPGRNESAAGSSTVILVSLDGFRWDYLDRGVTPNLDELAGRGVRAEGLIPSFPTKTFPNHYTLVTGLVPDRHGIVANTMYDPVFDARFSLFDRDEVQNGRWWEGEPVWVTAERYGHPTAPLFWPGAEAEIDGIRPTHWLPYDGRMSQVARVQWVLDLLDLPEEDRPVFCTLYFAETDDVGHAAGPDSDEILTAIASVDEAVGLLIAGLRTRDLLDRTNVVVVSDHGMISTSRKRVVFVDDYVDLAVAMPVDWNPVLALWPAEEDMEIVYEALHDAHPEMAIYRRDEIPDRFEYGSHRRTPPILGLAAPGWTITNHPYFDERPERADGGNHGFDNAAKGMQGLFVAAGPAFSNGVRVPAFNNTYVYTFLMTALGLPAASGTGDLAEVPGILDR